MTDALVIYLLIGIVLSALVSRTIGDRDLVLLRDWLDFVAVFVLIALLWPVVLWCRAS